MKLTQTFKLGGRTFHTDAETHALLERIVPRGKAANDNSAVFAVLTLGLETGRIVEEDSE